MRKIKVMIASMFGAIALVFACVFGTRINAADAIEAKTYYLYAKDFFTSTSNGVKTAPNNASVTPVSLQDTAEYYADAYGNNRANSNAAVSNPSGFDTSNWEYEYYSGGTRTITITAGDTQAISCSIFGYGSSTSKSVRFGSEAAQTCAKKNTVYEFNNSGTYLGSMSISVTDKITIAEIRVTITNATTYTVSFDNNGGTGTIASQSIVSGNYATAPVSNPTYSGHSFTGWYTSEDNGVTLSDNTFDFATTAITGDITLYAGWASANTANVTFKSTTYDNDLVIEAVNGVISSWPEKPFKEGYVFDGWFNGTTEYLQSGTYNSDITLTAQFTKSVLAAGHKYTFNPSNISISGKAAATSSDGYYFINNTDTSKGVRTSGSTFTVGNGLDSTTSLNYLGFTIPANSYAVINLTAKRATDSDSTKYARLYFNGENASTGNLTTDYADYSVIYFNNSNTDNLVKMYRNGNKTVTISKFDVAVYSSVATEIEAQSRGTGTAIRFAATLTNVGSLDVVSKWNYTLSMEDKDDVVSADKTVLYTAISGTNGKAAADNTYYIVLTIQNVPATYNGKDLKCKFTITLSDGSTIETDVVAETINVSVSE